jgi:predicted alpha/beta superfamily hydrolase
MKQSNVFRFLGALLAIYAVSFFGPKTMAQAEGTDVVIGQSLTLTSKILNREVTVLISVPDGYNASSTHYPVLYDLNSFLFTYACGAVELLGRTRNIPEMIVVGVPALRRGYVPTPFEERGENPSGADLSIKFLREELIPFVEKNYRTTAFRILYGHSVGGLFTMYTLFNHPDLFTAYIAGSPWFQTNNQYWLKNIEKMAKERKLNDKFLFMTVGKEETELTLDTFKELEKWMNDKPIAGLTWKSAWVEGDHASMVGRNNYDGLMYIFNGWKMPSEVLRNADVETMEEYLKTDTAKWVRLGLGSTDILQERRFNSLGYQLLGRREYEKAVKILSNNVKRFPKSFNAHDSLGEAYMRMGDKEKAIKYYKLAIKLNPGDTEYAKRILQNSRDKLRELGVEN